MRPCNSHLYFMQIIASSCVSNLCVCLDGTNDTSKRKTVHQNRTDMSLVSERKPKTIKNLFSNFTNTWRKKNLPFNRQEHNGTHITHTKYECKTSRRTIYIISLVNEHIKLDARVVSNRNLFEFDLTDMKWGPKTHLAKNNYQEARSLYSYLPHCPETFRVREWRYIGIWAEIK